MEIQSQSAPSSHTVVVQGNSSGAIRSGAPTAAATTETSTQPPQPDLQSLQQAVRDMSELINVTEPPQLVFSIDDATEKLIVRVTDASTGELIRQLPSEEALAIARSLDRLQGLLLKQEA